jgi:endonuclease/exonuclease/phosphatase family metal-dependent hydrolase
MAAALYGGGVLTLLTSAILYWRGKQQQSKIEGLKADAGKNSGPKLSSNRGVLRVLSQNVWGHMCGSGGPDTAARLTALAKYVEREEIDVVLAQELFTLSAGPIWEASNYVLFAEAMHKAGLVYMSGGETFKPLFQNHGLAIFSRYPIVRSLSEPFPTTSEPINSKGYAAATIRVPSGDSPDGSLLVHVFDVHLDSRDHNSKKAQVNFLSTAVRRYLATSTLSPAVPQTVIPLVHSGVAAAASSDDVALEKRKKKRKTSSESPMDSPHAAADGGVDDDEHEDIGEDARLLSEQTGPALRPTRAGADSSAASSVQLPPGVTTSRRGSLGRVISFSNVTLAGAGAAGGAPSTGGRERERDAIVIVAGDFNICSYNEKATPSWLYPHLADVMLQAGCPIDLFPGPPKGTSRETSGWSLSSDTTAPLNDEVTIPTACFKKKNNVGFRALDHAWLSPEARRRVAVDAKGKLSRRVVSVFCDGHSNDDGSDYRRAPPVSDHRGLLFDLNISTASTGDPSLTVAAGAGRAGTLSSRENSESSAAAAVALNL